MLLKGPTHTHFGGGDFLKCNSSKNSKVPIFFGSELKLAVSAFLREIPWVPVTVWKIENTLEGF